MATSAALSSIATDPPATIAELLHRLGDLPAERVRFHPTPGSATEADLIRILDRKNIPCELVEGVLMEKGMRYRESLIAGRIIILLGAFVLPRRFGELSGADGMMRLMPDLVRIPDVAFTARERFPDGRIPEAPIPDLVPDLAVEVLSESNSKAEIDRKLRECFEAGVRLVWLVDPEARTLRVHDGPTTEESTLLREGDSVDGGDVLPGFAVAEAELFPSEDI